MKNIFLLLCLFFFTFLSFSQNKYSWAEQDLNIVSDNNFEAETSDISIRFWDNSVNITIDVLGGMEGIDGLAGSLDTYASSFGYLTTSKAKEYNENNNIKAAILSTKKDNEDIIMCLFSDNSYKKHYIIEAKYRNSGKADVYNVIKNLTFGKVKTTTTNVTSDVTPRQPEEITQPTNNKRAPNFRLTSFNGNKLSLSDLRGKTVLLDFWGTWCKPCIKLIPSLKILYDKYKDKNFEILSIANDNDLAKWKRIISLKKMNWSNVIDNEEIVSTLYKIEAYPTLILINSEGEIIQNNTEKAQVETYLQELNK